MTFNLDVSLKPRETQKKLTLVITVRLGLRGRVFEQGSVLVQQVDQHLQQADLTQHVAEDGVVAGQLQQRPHSCDAAGVRRAGLEQHADAEQLLTGNVVEAEDHKLQQLKVLDLRLGQLGHALCKLRQSVLRLQDEIVGWIGGVDVPDGVQQHAGQAAGFGPQEGVLQHSKGLDVTHRMSWRGEAADTGGGVL